MSRPATPAAPPAYVGVFDLFQVGIGPSSSHTVGPMRAAADFVADLGADAARVGSVEVTLYGSLAATGRGHGTLEAVLVGLEGARPETVQPAELRERVDRITAEHRVQLPGGPAIALGVDDIALEPRTILDRHTNGMHLIARDGDGAVISEALYFSVGGGTVVREDPAAGLSAEVDLSAVDPQPAPADAVAYPFTSADELLEICTREGISIAEVVIANETANRSAAEVHAGLREIWEAMDECISAGVAATGVLPGGLKVPRRAPELHRRLLAEDPDRLPEHAQEWVNLVALAVNEENAGGGRVVTAPTNGAAGIIPAVLHYARWYTPAGRDGAQDEIVATFLLTAAAIGTLFKTRASISGAEVGCQGEVGSASSMAAGGLAAVLGGTPAQVENAAEIAMEHHLGLTCDPVGGLVQIPCIERNAIAAGTAINAVRIAMRGDGSHLVSLDAVIETMRQTGHDMNDRYKETAQGGLAVNVVEC